MDQGSRRKAVVEGAIPAKGNAFGEAGGFGLGDSHGQKQDASGARDLGELYPRFRDPSKQQPIASAPGGTAIQRSRNPLCKAGRKRGRQS